MINNMEDDKDCSDLMDQILKELHTTKEQSIEISNKLNSQTEQLEQSSEHLEHIEYEADVSKWHIHHIKSTFGKIYKTLHKYPTRISRNKADNQNRKKDTLDKIKKDTFDKIYQEGHIKTCSTGSKLDSISAILDEVKEIHLNNNIELEHQNELLENTIEKTDNVDDKIFNNILDIKTKLNK